MLAENDNDMNLLKTVVQDDEQSDALIQILTLVQSCKVEELRIKQTPEYCEYIL